MSTQFKDDSGRAWTVSLNIGNAQQVKDQFDIDLTKVMTHPEIFTQLGDDPYLLHDIIYFLSRCDDVEEKPSKEDFLSALHGDTIEKSSDALMAGIIAFFPNQNVRAALTVVLNNVNQRQKKDTKEALEKFTSGMLT